MTKNEAERAFCQMFDQWGSDRYPGLLLAEVRPSWSEFLDWVDIHYRILYSDLRSKVGSRYDVQAWFERYFRERHVRDSGMLK